jgi:DNA-binding FadR family transcriptional regulator
MSCVSSWKARQLLWLRAATADDLNAMERALHSLEQHLDDPVLASEHDLAFHEAIGVATHNPCYRQLLQYLNVQIRLAVRAAENILCSNTVCRLPSIKNI